MKIKNAIAAFNGVLETVIVTAIMSFAILIRLTKVGGETGGENKWKVKLGEMFSDD